MGNSVFRFKQFAVEQSDVPMKVGTDGVLLGAWVHFDGSERRILDIGTGTGVIALIAAQRSTAEYIAGIDIMPVAVDRAKANFALSPWAERLHVGLSSAQEFAATEPFDVIISNPPYFVDALLPPDDGRTKARHAVSLSLDELDEALDRLLATDGRAALILPPAEMLRFAAMSRLCMVRRCDVRFVPNGAVKRVMAEFGRSAAAECRCGELTIETERRGEFSEEYRRLMQDFYLKF
ncbi:MAG: tRNA1(Val) (adenine(37)-N6)-methyltransferase [Alistipes sp.]